ncbi:trypsin-like serine peptidase [Chitinophaga sp.]|uniref:trypsin-like serine peptidase n=1 Tax=Chitinophaga sp. TaxID=1869181 RepID=UPI002B70AEA4|nr:trypsin-like serine protease [Chitinophaga sp.]HWV66064.1 trypsin-like serine protease [Chitinophaga sp.]
MDGITPPFDRQYTTIGNDEKAGNIFGNGFGKRNDPRDTTLPAPVPIKELEKRILIGKDDRFPVNPGEFPYNAVCLLIIQNNYGEEFFGTGFFIGPRCVITAGHCVYFNNRWASRITVIPGALGAQQPYGSMVANKFKSVEGWVLNDNANFDHGAIILKDDTLFKSSRSLLAYKMYNGDAGIEIPGYPVDKEFTQWSSKGNIEKATDYRIFYEVDTVKGSSGSPVVAMANGKRVVVGVHNNGDDLNSGAVINSEIISLWKDWLML